MDEAKMYEALGRKQAVIDSQDAAYTALLGILAGVVSGCIPVKRIIVHPASRSWEILPADPPKSTPE